MYLLLRKNQVIDYCEGGYHYVGSRVVCEAKGSSFEEATIVNIDNTPLPVDIDTVKYEYVNGVFIRLPEEISRKFYAELEVDPDTSLGGWELKGTYKENFESYPVGDDYFYKYCDHSLYGFGDHGDHSSGNYTTYSIVGEGVNKVLKITNKGNSQGEISLLDKISSADKFSLSMDFKLTEPTNSRYDHYFSVRLSGSQGGLGNIIFYRGDSYDDSVKIIGFNNTDYLAKTEIGTGNEYFRPISGRWYTLKIVCQLGKINYIISDKSDRSTIVRVELESSAINKKYIRAVKSIFLSPEFLENGGYKDSSTVFIDNLRLVQLDEYDNEINKEENKVEVYHSNFNESAVFEDTGKDDDTFFNNHDAWTHYKNDSGTAPMWDIEHSYIDIVQDEEDSDNRYLRMRINYELPSELPAGTTELGYHSKMRAAMTLKENLSGKSYSIQFDFMFKSCGVSVDHKDFLDICILGAVGGYKARGWLRAWINYRDSSAHFTTKKLGIITENSSEDSAGDTVYTSSNLLYPNGSTYTFETDTWYRCKIMLLDNSVTMKVWSTASENEESGGEVSITSTSINDQMTRNDNELIVMFGPMNKEGEHICYLDNILVDIYKDSVLTPGIYTKQFVVPEVLATDNPDVGLLWDDEEGENTFSQIKYVHTANGYVRVAMKFDDIIEYPDDYGPCTIRLEEDR